jgi:hypothetical protein
MDIENDNFFKISFKDEDEKFSYKNGLPISKISEWLKAFCELLQENSNDLVISGIETGSYAMSFCVKSENAAQKIKSTHKKIGNQNFDEMNDLERSYAKYTNRFLKDNRCTMFITNKQNKYNAYIKPVSDDLISLNNSFYYEIGDIFGIITSIGGSTIDGSVHIMVQGFSKKIFINKKQELSIFQHYKKNKLCLYIKKKIRISNHEVLSASLLDYEFIDKVDTLWDVVQTTSSLFHQETDDLNKLQEIRNNNYAD